jgi:hypothetical protein
MTAWDEAFWKAKLFLGIDLTGRMPAQLDVHIRP